MVGFYLLFSLLPLMGFNDREAIKLISLQEPNPSSLHSFSPTSSPLPIAVFVTEEDLPIVSSSVSAAESWLKSHVLVHFPSTRITNIVVGRGVLCNKNLEHHWSSVLPSVKNLYYSLVKWGLVKEIELSAALSSDCLDHHPLPTRFKGDIPQDILKPLVSFLQDSNLTYSIDPPSHSSHHQAALERLGLSGLRVIRIRGEAKPMSRKLSSLSFPSFPERPKNPPSKQFTPAPDSGEEQNRGLWCVAKPTVPVEKLQEAMDYACGEGGADCEEIRPNGSCYYPDNVVAHASFAFNSYWQKKKQSGGSCSFDGMAMLISTSDPISWTRKKGSMEAAQTSEAKRGVGKLLPDIRDRIMILGLMGYGAITLQLHHFRDLYLLKKAAFQLRPRECSAE